jgi:hypothetical protein
MGRLNGRWAVRGAAMAAALALVVPVATRAALASDAESVREARKTLAVFQKNDPALAKFAARSAGYAVFPTITKGAIGVGGAHGTGVLFVKGKAMGKASLTQVTVGAQLGGLGRRQVQGGRGRVHCDQGRSHGRCQRRRPEVRLRAVRAPAVTQLGPSAPLTPGRERAFAISGRSGWLPGA